MSIQNFNTFQNKADSNLAKNTEKYIIEALANLGQRYSMQGDGFATRVSTLYDLIDNFNGYNSESYICKVDYSNDFKNVEFHLVDNNLNAISNINTTSIPVSQIISKIKTNQTEDSTSNVSIEINNGVEDIDSQNSYDSEDTNYSSSFDSYYEKPISIDLNIDETDLNMAKNVFMYSNNTNFVFSLEEEIEGDENRFVCEKYNKYTNKLESAIRIFKNETTIDEKNYDHTLLYMISNGDNTYKLFVYHMNFSLIPELSENGITTIARHAHRKYDKDGNELTNQENEDISFSPETFVTDLYTRCSKSDDLNTIANTVFAKEPKSYNVTFDGTSYKLTRNENEENTEVSNNFDKYEKFVQYFEYDLVYLYSQLKSSYSDLRYLDSTENSSYKRIILEAIKNLFIHTYCQQPIYIPLDYQFEYVYNTNKPWQVYFSTTDIILRDVIEMKPGKPYTVFAYQDNSGIVRVLDKSTDIEKITFYKFNVEYDPNNKNTIFGITVSKHFTLPYINRFGYWVINDINTEVYAQGKDAGNPNIIIVETIKGKDMPNILTMSNKEYFESLNWVTKQAIIELPKKISKDGNEIETSLAISEESSISGEYLTTYDDGSGQTIRCEYLVPTLNNTNKKRLEENIEKLQYAIVINITTVDNIIGYEDTNFKNIIDSIYGADGRLTTIWTLQESAEDKCGYGFKFIKTPSETAIDMNYLANFVNMVGWVLSNYRAIDPDNFTFTQLVFDRADAQMKNNDNYIERVYPVIKNESIRNSDTSDIDTGLNNFNLKIQYNDTLEASYYDGPEQEYLNSNKSYVNGIASISQSDTRYYERWHELNSTSKTSNSIYTYTTNSSDHYTEYVPGTLDKSVPTLDLSEILVRDLNSINRMNVVSFDSNSSAYYSYIGTDYTIDDKSILKIGTGTQNINIGDKTLVSSKSEELFNKQRQVNIEFDNTRITAYAYVGNDLITEKDTISYGTTWRRYDLDGTTYWTTMFRQGGRFFMDPAKVYRLSNDSSVENSYLDKFSFSNENIAYGYSFIAMTVPEQYSTATGNNQLPFDMYISDLVWIPSLLHTVCPQIIDNTPITIKSNNDVIYKTNNDSVSYIGVRLNSTMLEDLYLYNETDHQVTTLIDSSVESMNFISNEIDITYYKTNDTYHFIINDNNNSNFMTYLYKIRQQYS